MKKAFLIILTIMLLSVIVCGCSSNKSSTTNTKNNGTTQVEEKENEKQENSESKETNNTSNSENATNNSDDDLSFSKPSEVEKVDTKKQDPSTNDMKFEYDDNGRIIKCFYKSDGKDMYINYQYHSDSTVVLYVFKEDILVDEKLIQLSLYDQNGGFTVVDGYYLKGYTEEKR